MGLTLTTTSGNALLQGFSDVTDPSFLDLAALAIYQTQVLLVIIRLIDGPWSTPEGSSMAIKSLPITQAADASGKANRFVLFNDDNTGEALSNGTAVILLSGTISGIGGGGDIETSSVSITEAENQTLNAFVLTVASNGELGLTGSFTFQ